MWCQYIHSSAATPPQWLSTVLPLTHGLQAMHYSPMTHGIRRSLFWCCRRCFVWYAMQSLPTWCFEFRSVQLCERQPLICMDALTRKRTRWAWDEPYHWISKFWGLLHKLRVLFSYRCAYLPIRYYFMHSALLAFRTTLYLLRRHRAGIFLPFHVTPTLRLLFSENMSEMI